MNRLITTLFLLYLIPSISSFGQREVFFYSDLKIVPEIELSKNGDSIEEIINKDHLMYQKQSDIKIQLESDYWLRFDFEPWFHLFEKYDTLYLNTGLLDQTTYFFNSKGSVETLQVDYFKDKVFKSSIINRSFYPVTKSNLINGRFIIVKTKANYSRGRIDRIRFLLHTSNEEFVFDYRSMEDANQQKAPVLIFFGLAIGLFIINILLYFSSFKKIYLYYGLFLIFQGIYYSNLNLSINTNWEFNYPKAQYIISTLIQVLINLSYLLFIRSFLDMKKYYPKLNKAVELIAYILVAFIIIMATYMIIDPHWSLAYDLMDYQRYAMSLFALYGIIHLTIFRKSELVYFVVIGTTIFVTGALSALFLGNIMYMLFGAAIESLVFIAGLAYNIKTDFKKRLQSEQEATKANESALRAQLNPHFIFNSLNSIQHLITKGDKVNALKYLTKFSKLLRQVLETSIEVNVPLNREKELLTMYLELESLRFNNDFSYSIEISENLDEYNQEIPLFLIQPFVENAILHGLLPKEGKDKDLKIVFDDQEHCIVCSITDNGIGREAAKANQKVKSHISRGISVSEKRLEMLCKRKENSSKINYIDLEQGTRVDICIPKN